MSHQESDANNRTTRRDTVKIVAVGVIVAICLGTGIAIVLGISAAVDVAQLEARSAARAEMIRQDRQLAQDAYDEAQKANKELRRRGEREVVVPAPGQAPDADVIANAAVPVVLEKLAENGVSADGIAAQVASYIRDNPQGPSTRTLAALIADHYRRNPPEDGEQGPQGRPPSEAEILAAVAEYCSDEAGPCDGPPGPPGDEGGEGPKGERGEKGAKGDPGPACPEGYSSEQGQWDHDGKPTTEPKDAIVCVKQEEDDGEG